MNKYNIGDLIVDDEGEAYTITQILRFIDDSYGYDTDYYDKDNDRILQHYMSEKYIETMLSGKHEIKAKHYPVKKD